jgi:hypothetical protein
VGKNLYEVVVSETIDHHYLVEAVSRNDAVFRINGMEPHHRVEVKRYLKSSTMLDPNNDVPDPDDITDISLPFTDNDETNSVVVARTRRK